MSGEWIGEYELVETIGQGGMATVYKAYQPSFDRFVALKLLPRDLSADPRALKRFQQEARTIARLEHPAILPVYAYGEYEGMPYIVMRLLEAGSLRRKMFYEGMPLPLAARVVEQVADALDYAHSQGVVHRDLKPSNILLDDQGNAYLTDFGIAQMMDSVELGEDGSTGVIGTPGYMSPEQCQGKPAIPASDIYALGIIIYEILTGKLPFEAESPLAVMYQQVREPLPSVRSTVPTLPAAFDRVLQRATAKNPAARYPAAGALAADFRRVVDELARREAAAQTPDPLPSPSGERRRPAARPGQPAAEEKTERKRRLPVFASILVGLIVLAAAGGVGVLVLNSLRGNTPADLPPTQFGAGQGDEFGVPIGETATPPVGPTPTFDPNAPAASQTPEIVVATGTGQEAVDAESLLTSTPETIIVTLTPQPTVTTFAGATNTPPVATLAGTNDSTPPVAVPGRIAYTRGTGDGGEIMVMDDTGQSQQALTDNGVYDGEPDWSPDGNRLAFESEREGAVRQIYVMDGNGGNVRQLTQGEQMASHPDWSPSGTTIAFEWGSGDASEIYAIPVDGGGAVALTNNAFGDRAPQFSPDGSQIAYMTEQRGVWEIAVMSYPDGEQTAIYDCPASACRFPAWSPDGESIVYNTLDSTGRVDEVWVVETDSGLSAALVGEGQNGRPVWSGSGGSVFFNRTTSGNTDIYRFDLSSGEFVQLTTSTDNEYGPDWITR